MYCSTIDIIKCLVHTSHGGVTAWVGVGSHGGITAGVGVGLRGEVLVLGATLRGLNTLQNVDF